MKRWFLVIAMAGLLAACEREVAPRPGAGEGGAAQSAAGASADEGKAARRAGR